MYDMQEKLNYLDDVLAEISHAQTRAEIEMKEMRRVFAERDAKAAESDAKMKAMFAKRDAKAAESDAKMKAMFAKRDAEMKAMFAERDAKTDARIAESSARIEAMEADRVATMKALDAKYQKKHDARTAQQAEWIAQAREDTRKMNKAWGDMANRLGTLAEDVVAPNLPRLALEEFGMSKVQDMLMRATRVSRRGSERQREYDVICAGADTVIVADVKSTPRESYIRDAKERLADFFDFYPEYEGRQLIGIFASWSIDAKFLPLISEAGLYGMAMGDDTMDIVARPAS